MRSAPLSSCFLAMLGLWLSSSVATARVQRDTSTHESETESAVAAGMHIVGPKDTLYGLAKQYGTTVEKIKSVNGLRSNVLRDGQKLRMPGMTAEPMVEEIPEREQAQEEAIEPEVQDEASAKRLSHGASVHIVQKGETLFGIAKKYEITVAALKKTNGLRGDTISRGQKLRLPGGEQPEDEGILKKGLQAIKDTANHLTGNDEEPAETKELISTTASTEKRNGKTRPAQKVIDENLATYLVTPYDSLESIALDFKTTSARLMELNKLANDSELRTKKQILVPGNGLKDKWSKAY